jgi:hypothetical protein
MALTITQKVMRSTETAHTAKLAHDRAGVPFVIPGDGDAEAEGAWRVSWLPGQLLDRDGAVAAMILADLVSEGTAWACRMTRAGPRSMPWPQSLA